MAARLSVPADIAYLHALIDLLEALHGAGPRGIFMTGGSNGAMMLFYATRRAERLAAIAPVVSAMFSFEDTPARPLPTLLINGAADAEVPLEGGMSRNPLVRSAQAVPFKPVEETVAFWRRVNRWEPSAQTKAQGTVTTRTWAATPGGAVTSVVVDAAGGHGWPGTPALRAGNAPIQAFKGAGRVWEFFKQHLP
ncbi:MAG: alpha/beta hydrolase family esterase [bacterium]|nr:hypothetical protein [Betaproteobacteria bacterium]